MTIMPDMDQFDNTLEVRFISFFKRFHLNSILRQVNATKAKGVPAPSVVMFLMGLVFTHMNLYTFLGTCKEKVSFGKDVIYRFLNTPSAVFSLKESK